MRSEINHEYEKQEAVAKEKHKAELDKQQAVADEKNRKQKVITYSTGIGLAMVIIFAGFMYNRFKITQNKKNY
ncbi:MAG: hypothetical protein IPJ32_21245 [Sphingobacteriaceae bacterium]|nr:hypothetical protein [Sphingobacteriaceae bacterium]